jgi:hypothetical protein
MKTIRLITAVLLSLYSANLYAAAGQDGQAVATAEKHDAVATEEVSTRTYQLPDYGTLQLQVPRSWRDAMQQPSDDLPPVIMFSPKEGKAFQFMLTPIYSSGQQLAKVSLADIKDFIERSAKEAQAQAVEKVIPVKELHGTSVNGYYFFATDRAPKPGEWKYLTQGIFLVDNDLSPTFTILTNDGAEHVIEQALSMIKNLVLNKKAP